MTIKIGDTLPEGTLAEFIESETEGCALGPNTFNVQDLVKGKKIAIFGLPAPTPRPARTARAGLRQARRRPESQGRR
jgi:peroxiredoxin